MSRTTRRPDPYQSFRFFVEVDGLESAAFTECSGLEVTTDVKEYEEGGENTFVHKLPGRTKYTNITLKWGTTESLDLWKWYQAVTLGFVERKMASIVQYNWKGDPVRRWNLFWAYPVKWVGPSFRTDSSEVGIETLELAHNGFIVE